MRLTEENAAQLQRGNGTQLHPRLLFEMADQSALVAKMPQDQVPAIALSLLRPVRFYPPHPRCAGRHMWVELRLQAHRPVPAVLHSLLRPVRFCPPNLRSASLLVLVKRQLQARSCLFLGSGLEISRPLLSRIPTTTRPTPSAVISLSQRRIAHA